jgi:ABC-type lipoprotein export system ATPase subunit
MIVSIEILLIQNGTFALKNIVFDAHPGDLICIIGPVGSGKVCELYIGQVIGILFICLEFPVTSINR